MKKLGFGCMRLPLTNADEPGSIAMETVKEMVDTFLEKGFTYFDTAYMYHDFKSELAIKEALVNRYPRDRFTLATKMPTMSLKAKEDMERIFNEQLEKCGVEFFDYYLLHNLGVDHYAIAEKYNAFEFIQQKKAAGKVKTIGFSYHDNAALLDKILTEHPETEVVQLQMNYLDWDSESIESRKCYEVARKHGKEVIVMEPVKGGILANLPQEAEALLKKHQPDMSIASWAIRFAASQEGILTVLSGMSDKSQLLDNLSYMENFTPLNEKEMATVKQTVDIINDSITIPCTACAYCTEGCPEHIAIPQYFSLYNNEKQFQSKGFSVQQVYYDNYTKTFGKASNCVGCGQCEEQCPQHLSIIKHLEEVSATFEKPQGE